MVTEVFALKSLGLCIGGINQTSLKMCLSATGISLQLDELAKCA